MAQAIYVKVYQTAGIGNALFDSTYQGVPVVGTRFVYASLPNVPSIRSKSILDPSKYPGSELLHSLTVAELVTLANA
jgi:hypothetical protein